MQSYIHSFHDAETLRISTLAGMFRIDESYNVILEGSGGGISAEEPVAVSDTLSLAIYIFPASSADYIYDASYGPDMPSDMSDPSATTAQYKDLVEQIGDTSLDKHIRLSGSQLAQVLLNKITSVTITCDKAFDAQHPAGSSLNDLFTIAFNDPIALIENDYQIPAGYYQYPCVTCDSDMYPSAVLLKKLSTVDFAEHPYLDNYWNCRLDKAPAATDIYTFTVRVDFADRTPLEASATMTIEGEA